MTVIGALNDGLFGTVRCCMSKRWARCPLSFLRAGNQRSLFRRSAGDSGLHFSAGKVLPPYHPAVLTCSVWWIRSGHRHRAQLT